MIEVTLWNEAKTGSGFISVKQRQFLKDKGVTEPDL